MDWLPSLGECIWCGKTEMTEEHVIDQQFAKALGVPYPVSSFWGDARLPGDTGEVKLEDRVCRTCNQNWMKKLDDQTIRFLRPALKSLGTIEMDLKQQRTFARWATKVALLLEIRAHDMTVKDPDTGRAAETRSRHS